MAEDPQNQDLMRYDLMAQEALKGVVRETLRRAASPQGLPNPHHVYVSFATQADGVSLPPDLAEKYPEEMTIVLQHQFWDLEISDEQFSVVLRFGGQPKKLVVPFRAVTRFHDPTVRFGLEFDPPPRREAKPEAPPPADAPKSPAGASDGPKIVSLDHFRKK